MENFKIGDTVFFISMNILFISIGKTIITEHYDNKNNFGYYTTIRGFILNEKDIFLTLKEAQDEVLIRMEKYKEKTLEQIKDDNIWLALEPYPICGG